ncbi:hypothetical protein COX05_03340 [candidate division WWE3 bacterium CG22_combo_CG10-13_8_21_14_all_39_12]|uniref:Glycosyl transferase family 1 domain-containing protein n=1 Tax=candidate division WWE3 bacterium CG22_combo_CG10-13_8_21_14_all_39_12 TaxID=1975094 RepID=A0A2H0BFG1_UNCKA|nr:MAG: hypothetical protein COX05_03340 [candidate division WWE3 bacterium CG22_combo_CG10-13_8_21_14_all_39_12]
MNIGHIATEYKPITGGAQTYLANLYEIFKGEGHDQRVYQFNDNVHDPELELVPHAPKVFNGGRALDLWWFNFLLPLKFKSLSKEDTLICHYAFHSLPLFWKKNVIVLSHGCEWDIPATSLSQKLKIKIAQWSFKHFKYLVANDTNYFRQLGVDIKPKERMFEEVLPGKWYIPNCVDTSVFTNVDPATDFPEHSIVVPRNISHARGIHLSIEAFAQFKEKFPETTLVVVGGGGDEQYKDYLNSLIQKHNLEGAVVFKGSIPWALMPGVYNACEMTVVPTLQREGTSLSALESMACGTATVSTNAQGLADLPTAQSDITADDLARVMIETYTSKDSVALSQQQEVRTNYNINKWKEGWLKVISQVQIR